MDDFYLLLFIIYGGPALVGLAIAPKEKRILFGIITFFSMSLDWSRIRLLIDI